VAAIEKNVQNMPQMSKRTVNSENFSQVNYGSIIPNYLSIIVKR